MIRILVVEDDGRLNELVRMVLEKNGYETIGVYHPDVAFEVMKKVSFNLIVSDIMMPIMDGFKFAKAVRENDSNIPILFITAKDSFEDKRLSYSIGVDDYMVKPIDLNELVLRVGALLRRSTANSDKKMKINDSILDFDTLTIIEGKKKAVLSLKEFKIVYKLLESPNKIFTRTQIMNECWGIYNDSFDRTIDVHITHLREKIAEFKDFSIITVRGLGYKAVINKK